MGEAMPPHDRQGADLDDIFSSDTEDEQQGAAKVAAQKSKGEALKAEGNRLLQEGDLKKAITSYKRALTEIWALYKNRSDEQARQLGLAIDLNLALCHLRLEDWQSARTCASRALEADSGSAKGLFRRGVAAARLGDLDAAEVDLKAAVASQAGPEAKKELAEVKRQLQHARSASTAVVKGFLQRPHPAGAAEDTGQEDVEKEREEQELENLEGEWVDGGEVLDELRQICAGLSAIAQRRILCESSSQRDAIQEQLELANTLLLGARAAGDAAAVREEDNSGDLMLENLFESIASGLGHFRPFFQLQEKFKGEFDALRVVRELPGGTGKLTLDVEMVRWGNEGLATIGDFAAPVFPPSGRPRNDEEAAWQQQLFGRFLQKDASKYVAGAAFMVLQEFRRLGSTLLWENHPVLDLGLAHGIYFASSKAKVPAADGLAVCAGQDKRQILVPSFTSLGVVHKWLLLAVQEDGEDGGQNRREVAVDLCAGSLGLLAGSSSGLVRSWSAHGDGRFVVRCERWGEDARALIQGPLGVKGGDLMRGALQAIITAAQVPFTVEDVLNRQVSAGPRNAMPSGKDSRAEVVRRLRLAAGSLGLPPAVSEGEEVLEEELEKLMKEAVTEYARRRLRKAGLLK